MAKQVHIGDGLERINAAIAVPPRLFADDWRVFTIRDWVAKVYYDDDVQIELTMLVYRERQNEEKGG